MNDESHDASINPSGANWLRFVECIADALHDSGAVRVAKEIHQDCLETKRRLWLTDSRTECLSKGFHRVQVLRCCVVVAEFYVLRGFPKKSQWCLLSATSRLQSQLLFPTLNEAREHGIQLTI
jgi:hypothetical protein